MVEPDERILILLHNNHDDPESDFLSDWSVLNDTNRLHEDRKGDPSEKMGSSETVYEWMEGWMDESSFPLLLTEWN